MNESSDAVREDLAWVADDFAALLGSAQSDALDAPSVGTRWTNRQLLFHMLLGQRITRMVIVVMGGFSRLPPGASNGFSRLLVALTRPYNELNWFGGVIGGRINSIASMRRQMDSVTSGILKWYDQADTQTLHRGMTVPSSWDPYYTPWMDRADLLRWAPRHYRHHRGQLSLASQPSPRSPTDRL
jgi:hypothetical protein